ncbi:MAG: LPS export ABC transporter periplasmic protein LptC [Rubricoccaceae bacterium]|nr:LPS export ABC transporter periplasmic protein LptC [Rubricoccaceae bacterium]
MNRRADMNRHVITILLGLAFIAGCSRSELASGAEVDVASLPDQETWGAVLYTSENGTPSLSLSAPYMVRFDRADSSYAVFRTDPQAEDTTRVRIRLFDRTGTIATSIEVDRLLYFDESKRFEGLGSIYAVLHRANNAELRARSFAYDETDQVVVISGDVFITTSDDRQLATERLVWDMQQRQFSAEGLFEMTSPSERIQGYGLFASEDLSRYTFSQASGEFEVEE